MSKLDPDCLRRARNYFSMASPHKPVEHERLADINIYMARGANLLPAMVHDQVREERATRHWFAHRRGGWTPTDIVLRSPLHETETWFDPRGARR